MPTDIRMYSCAFGDCFRITNNGNAGNRVEHLYVDFGIHCGCRDEAWRNNRYDQIIQDIPHRNVDFLLTHYHYDHYAGVIRMINQNHNPAWPHKRGFRDVYIPDVWSIADSIHIVQLLLLRDVFAKSMLDRGLSLFQFLISICHANGRIYFVQRGRTIQNRYTALWPTGEIVQDHAAALWETIAQQENEPDYVQDILRIANRLCAIMNRISGTQSYEMRINEIPQLRLLEQEFLSIADGIPNDPALRNRLGKFGHRINIIFHNTENCERNILFTGDAPGTGVSRSGGGVRMWRSIRGNFDGQVPLHGHYDVIKIPHHGTAGHYEDFTDLSSGNTVFLIPNGAINRWPITDQYSADANGGNCSVCCTSNGACNAAAPGCNCRYAHIVPEYPDPYQDL